MWFGDIIIVVVGYSDLAGQVPSEVVGGVGIPHGTHPGPPDTPGCSLVRLQLRK